MAGVSPDAVLVHDPIHRTAHRKLKVDIAYATSNDVAEQLPLSLR